MGETKHGFGPWSHGTGGSTVIRLAIGGAAVLAIGVSVLVAPTATAADDSDASGTVARGIIVGVEPGIGPLAATRAAIRATDTDASSPARISATSTVVDLGEFVPVDEAQRIANEIAGRPGIAWAEPDTWVTPAQPVFPDDPLFDEQWYLWDADAADGGFSVRAPDVWATTTGSTNTVVAVVDTGVAAHPDLAGTVVPGYDFVSYVPSANDGDAWDPNPADPGDWFDEADRASGAFPSFCRLQNSSWHGTHVAGIVAAVANNGYGISGTAPGLTVLNVRALGKCGGVLSDVAAAVRWSVGDTVIDVNTGQPVPVNPTPATVVNLSLGGEAACSNAMIDAIETATERGAIVISAAGNESSIIDEFVPANCPGVVRVVASDRGGARASYSNIGTDTFPATIAAPGGSSVAAILATDNTGTREPLQPTFGNKVGTSMATPIVSAAAGLLVSLGVDDPADIRARLIDAVQPFAAGASQTCTTITCGSGILDMGRLIEQVASITLTGERGTVRGRPGVIVNGVTVGIPEGTTVTPFVKLPGQTSYTEGIGLRQVQISSGTTGEFTWQRRTGKKVYVYFRAETGEQSKRIIIPPR